MPDVWADSTSLDVSQPPRQLPADIAPFVGRAPDLAVLTAALAVRSQRRTAVAVIDGSGGMGKTALAVHWARRSAADFPDGQLYVNLRGYGMTPPLPPVLAQEMLLHSLGYQPGTLPPDVESRWALLQAATNGRRMLVLLDNARDAEQVRPLLPASSCMALITSRNQLRGLVARESVARISLGQLTDRDSAALLRRVVGADRTAAEPIATAALAALAGQTPLALRIIAERAGRHPGIRLADLVSTLREHEHLLDGFDAGDGDGTDLRAVFSWSYDSLDRGTARVFRLLGVHPGPEITLLSAAALAGQPVAEVRPRLDGLVTTHLLEQRGDGRYELHDLLRAYALEKAHQDGDPKDRSSAFGRILGWYLQTVYAADELFSPGRVLDRVTPAEPVEPLTFADEEAARQWCDDEYATLVAIVGWAADHGWPRHACAIAIALQPYLRRCRSLREIRDLHQAALGAADRLGDQGVRGLLLNGLGTAYKRMGQSHEAEQMFVSALADLRAAGDAFGEARLLGNLGLLYAETGAYEAALAHCTAGLALSQRLGDRRSAVYILDSIGTVHFERHDYARAIACWRRALKLGRDRRRSEPAIRAISLANLGRAYSSLGRHARAVRYYEQALALHRASHDRRSETFTLLHAGRSLRALGRPADAQLAWETALATSTELGDAKARATLTNLVRATD